MAVLVIAVAAGAATWWYTASHPFSPASSREEVQRTSKSRKPDPPIGHRQGASGWSLQHTARQGRTDISSLVEAYKQAQDCIAYNYAVQSIERIKEDPEWADLSKEPLSTLEHMDAHSARSLHIVSTLQNFCQGTDQLQLAQVYSDSMFEAALRGDPDSQTCFIISNVSPLLTEESRSSFERKRARYAKYAFGFTQSALERGDPLVAVNALGRHVVSPPMHPTVIDTVPKADRRLTWRMARLAALRGLPEQRKQIESDLERFKQKGLLGADEIDAANSWALQTYAQQFSGDEPINLRSRAQCYASPDIAP